MSLILDALRKSDRQRNRSHTEQLRWGPGPAQNTSAGLPPAAIILLLLAVLGLVGASAWFGSWIATERKEAEPVGEIMENDMLDTRSTEIVLAEPVRSLQGELATATGTSPEPTASTPVVERGGDNALPSEDLLLAPALTEMPPGFREQLPSLVINVHAWTEKPAERFVLINMQRYAEGERLREGPLLRQVTRDGVVLEFQGELFTLSRR